MTDSATMARMDAQEALPAATGGEGAVTHRPRIDPLTRLLVLRLHEAEPGRSAASIARTIGGISEASVRRLFEGHTSDTKALARQMMQGTVAERIENWERACEVAAEKGYHQPAMQYLEAAGAIEPKAAVQANVNVQPTISLSMNFGLGALKSYAPAQPAIEAETVPQLPEGKP